MKESNNLLLCVLCIFFVISTVGCSVDGKSNPKQAIAVSTIKVNKNGVIANHEYVGRVEEESASVISFQVAGNIEQIYVSEGDYVKKGDILARLNQDNLISTNNAAQASLKQAKDALDRLQILYDNQSLPEIKYVEVKTKLDQAKAAAEVSEKNLRESVLKAPFSGVIGEKRASVGENVLPSSPIFTLLNMSNVKIKIAVPEGEIADIKKGNEVEIIVPALKSKKYAAVVTEKGVVGNRLSHTYDVKIRPQDVTGLLPGMVCNVIIKDKSTDDAIVIPNRAIQIAYDNTHYVWCIKNGEATAVNVVIGELTDKGVIIESGVSEGDEVIVDGYQKVSEGMKVRVL